MTSSRCRHQLKPYTAATVLMLQLLLLLLPLTELSPPRMCSTTRTKGADLEAHQSPGRLLASA